MAKIKDNKLIVINNDGIEEECEILFTCRSNETNKNYLIYTSVNENDNNEYYVHAGTFDPRIEDYRIEPITDEKEWDTITDILQVISNEEQ